MKPTSPSPIWNEQDKIKIIGTNTSKQKHLIVKALIMLHLKIKHKKDSYWIKIYSHFPAIEKRRCDVYYENIRTKEAYAYEIKSNITGEWEREITKAYRDWEIYGMETTNYIIVDLDKLSDDLNELGLQIKKLIL